MSNKRQIDKFKQAAKEIDSQTDEKDFDNALKAIAKSDNSSSAEGDELSKPISAFDLRPNDSPLGVSGKLDNGNGVVSVEGGDHEVADYLSRAKKLCKPQ